MKRPLTSLSHPESAGIRQVRAFFRPGTRPGTWAVSGPVCSWATLLGLSLLLGSHSAQAAPPTAAQALKLTPLQADVEYEQPADEEIDKCSIEAESGDGRAGWIVVNGSGQTLRRFLDTNQDNKVDQWCYFQRGVEVYRDIDADFNGKADQYRWLGTSGTRWGLDDDEDGRIDRWKKISAEEVTAEVVAALREGSSSRFRRLLPDDDEIDRLGLGARQTREIREKVKAAAEQFPQLARRQQVVHPQTQWAHFGAGLPGLVPAGTDGAKKDLIVYENAAAVVETDGEHGQIGIGTLVQIDDAWRLLDAPQILDEEQASTMSGFFFHASARSRPEYSGAGGDAGSTAELQELITRLDRIDTALNTASPEQQKKLQGERADALEKLAMATNTAEERAIWIRQFADTVGAAVQSGDFPEGTKRLIQLEKQLAESSETKSLVPYVQFRRISAEYGQRLQAPNADYTKVQQQWVRELDGFVTRFADSDETAEAMLQLAIAHEFSGKDQQAVDWYAKIVQQHGDSDVARKAAGGKRRLESVGKPMTLQGKAHDGTPVDLADYRGKTVLIHYWATWCEPCKQDLIVLKAMQAKYARDGFALIGVSLDSSPQDLQEFLATESLPWPQVYEDGGLDSRLATEMGILTLPTMILVDPQGRVARRSIHAAELDKALGEILR